MKIINLYEWFLKEETSAQVVEMLTDDVYNVENAKIIIIMKEMSQEIVSSEYTESKERILNMFSKFWNWVETKLGDALLDNN